MTAAAVLRPGQEGSMRRLARWTMVLGLASCVGCSGGSPSFGERKLTEDEEEAHDGEDPTVDDDALGRDQEPGEEELEEAEQVLEPGVEADDETRRRPAERRPATDRATRER